MFWSNKQEDKWDRTFGLQAINLSEDSLPANFLFDMYEYIKNVYPEEYETDKIFQTVRNLTNNLRIPENKHINGPVDIVNFCRAWDNYKEYEIGKVEFIDLLYKCWKEKRYPKIDLLIVDEFQDLTKIQYLVFEFWNSHAKEIWIAGDPDQSLYSFAGGSPDYLINFPGQEIFLDKTFRLPKKILKYSRKVYPDAYSIKKGLESVSKYKGVLKYVHIDEMSKLVKKYKDEDTFVLTRSNFKLTFLKEKLLGAELIFKSINDDPNCQDDQDGSNAIITGKFRSLVNAIYNFEEGMYLSKGEVLRFVKHVNNFKIDITAVKNVEMEKQKRLCKNGVIKSIEQWVNNESITSTKFRFLRTFNELHGGDVERLFNRDVFQDIQLGMSASMMDRIVSNLTSKTQKAFLQIARKYDLSREEIIDPKISIGTIHSSKGKEARNVFIYARGTVYEERGEINEEEEKRVWYVAVTRTEEKLFIVNTSNDTKFLPR